MTDEQTIETLRARATELNVADVGALDVEALEAAIAEAEAAAEPPTLEELKARARELDVPGRSSMNRDELAAAIAEAEAVTGAGSADPGGTGPSTDAQVSTAGLEANVDAGAEPEPGTPEQTGRPDLLEVATDRAANRNPRVIGATQED